MFRFRCPPEHHPKEELSCFWTETEPKRWLTGQNVVKTKKGTEENGLFERLSWFDVFTFDVDGEVDVFTSMLTLSLTLTTTLQRKELSFWFALFTIMSKAFEKFLLCVLFFINFVFKEFHLLFLVRL